MPKIKKNKVRTKVRSKLKKIPSLPLILKKILVILIPLIIIIVLLKIFVKKPESGINYPTSEKILSPVENIKINNPDYNNYLSRISLSPAYYLLELVYDWQSLFDIFVSNTYNKELKFKISTAVLQTISSKVKRNQAEFFKGNSDEIIKEYGNVIKEECGYYKLDWRLILSIIKQESAFTSNAVSSAGAYGFMQIMPRTGAGLEQTLQLEEHHSPTNNLIAGIYYYALLVGRYDATKDDKYKFALASYNAGSGHVEDAMSIAYYLNWDYLKWDNVRETITMLGPQNDSLHKQIWGSKPPNGNFTNWKEPVHYVDNIIYYWGEYKRIYPEPFDNPKKKKRKND